MKEGKKKNANCRGLEIIKLESFIASFHDSKPDLAVLLPLIEKIELSSFSLEEATEYVLNRLEENQLDNTSKMTKLTFKEISGRYFLIYDSLGMKGFTKTNLKDGSKFLERIAKRHSRKTINTHAQCILYQSEFVPIDLVRLKNVALEWGIEGVVFREDGELLEFVGTNAEAIFAIAQTFLEMLNDLEL